MPNTVIGSGIGQGTSHIRSCSHFLGQKTQTNEYINKTPAGSRDTCEGSKAGHMVERA